MICIPNQDELHGQESRVRARREIHAEF